MVSEELFNNIIILYMLTAQGQGNIKKIAFGNKELTTD